MIGAQVAVAVRGGRIAAVGTEAEVRTRTEAEIEIVDLAGGALCPGFIDGHHHFSYAAILAQFATSKTLAAFTRGR